LEVGELWQASTRLVAWKSKALTNISTARESFLLPRWLDAYGCLAVVVERIAISQKSTPTAQTGGGLSWMKTNQRVRMESKQSSESCQPNQSSQSSTPSQPSEASQSSEFGLPIELGQSGEDVAFSRSTTCRGFGLVTFQDDSGRKCSLQESSAVDGFIWLGVDDADPKRFIPHVGYQDYQLPEGVVLSTRMHLTAEAALKLADELRAMALGVIEKGL
jgi:hypothetical protein